MFDDVYQAGTDAALADLARRPNAPNPKAPSFSLWRTLGAAGKSLPAGGAEVAGSAADILGAFGDVLGATGASGGGMFALQSEDERRQSDEAAKRIREQGVDYRTEAGSLFRGVAKDYMPDPVTAHGAEVAVAEFGRIAGKAIGASLLLGPIGGAVASGLEEGFTAADKLAEQGVDLGTRSAVGAVTAAVQAATFALPVAGQTWAQTGALAIGGGTGGFVAQQAATRAILDGADYSKLADQYDPFDPVGLALSTLLPLGFGAVGMRAAAKARTAQEAAAAARAEAEMIASPRPPGERTAVARATDEVVDAARVSLLRENVDAHRLTPADDLPAAAAHQTAVAEAIDQMAAGQRVEVTVPEAQAVRATEAMAERLRPLMDEDLAWPAPVRPVLDDGLRRTAPLTDARLDDPEIRQQLAWMVDQSGWAQQGGQMLRGDPNEPGTGGMGSVIGRTQWIAASDWYRELQGDASTKLPGGKSGVEQAIRKALEGEPMKPQERRAVRFMLEVAREDVDPFSATNMRRELEREALDPTPDNMVDAGLVARAAEIDDAAVERLAIQFENDDAGFMAGVERLLNDFQNDAAAARGAGDQRPADGAAPAGPAGSAARAGAGADRAGGADAGRVAGESPELDRAAAELERLNPDLPVRLDGMDDAVPLSELMARLRAEVAEDLAEVPLIETAALCALRAGT